VLEPLGKSTDSEKQGRPSLQVLKETPAIDLRILQANERTLLAWIRTGLALMGFGFVVARMGMWLREVQPTSAHGPWSGRLGAAFVVLGTISNALAAVRYVRVRKAIIEGREMIPGNAIVLMLAYGLVVLGGVLGAYIVTR
jgi:putative membrane protein